MSPCPRTTTLFPYTTLFRSESARGQTERMRRLLLQPSRNDKTIEEHNAILAGLKARNADRDRKSTRLNSSHLVISYAVFCLKKKKRLKEAKRTVPETATNM